MIVPLGHWVMGEACRQTKQWLDAGIAPPLIAVNMSGVQFKTPLELENDIAAILTESGLPPNLLELELTESVLMEASREHNELLLRLREMGHRIAIDDFGSGYSSLDYLRRYPADRIKIAQTFHCGPWRKIGNRCDCEGALGLARELGMRWLSRAWRPRRSSDCFEAWGCRIIQGHYFARPLGVADATALLRTGKIAPVRAGNIEVGVPV